MAQSVIMADYTVRIKRGDTFALQAYYTTLSDTGDVVTPDNISDWVITSEIRDCAGSLIQTLLVQIQDPFLAQFEASAAPEQTAIWQIGTHKCDVKAVAPDGTRHSETFLISVTEPVTA